MCACIAVHVHPCLSVPHSDNDEFHVALNNHLSTLVATLDWMDRLVTLTDSNEWDDAVDGMVSRKRHRPE